MAARKIVGAVRVSPKKGEAGQTQVFKPGDEDKLAAAEIDAAAYKRLQEKGVLKGFNKGVAAAEGEEVELPAIKDLREHLKGMDDIEEIEAMADSDDRSSAAEIYEARLNALRAENEEVGGDQ